MKSNNSDVQKDDKLQTTFSVVPLDFLESIIGTQKEILKIIQPTELYSINGYLTEKKARELINKRATWFWQKRKSGQLPFKKIGSTIYYLEKDILALFTA
jgi:hypothetical protein